MSREMSASAMQGWRFANATRAVETVDVDTVGDMPTEDYAQLRLSGVVPSHTEFWVGYNAYVERPVAIYRHGVRDLLIDRIVYRSRYGSYQETLDRAERRVRSLGGGERFEIVCLNTYPHGGRRL